MRAIVGPRFERLITARPPRPAVDTTRQPIWLWDTPKGIDSRSALTKIAPEYAFSIKNFMFFEGQLRSRLGTRLLGNNAASQVLQTTDFLRAAGKKVTIRFCLRHLEVMNYADNSWRSFAIDLHGSESDLFTWTSWGDKLLFSNFVDGMWELNFQDYVIKKVEGAPGARHLTVFGNRVIATAVNSFSQSLPYRIQWSEKNDYTDWTSIGSGFEDLFGAPAGVVDEAMVTIPRTDEAALVIRASSVWQMSISGVARAPFRFSRVLKIGSRYRYSIAETSRGIVFINDKSVYIVDIGYISNIGESVIKRIKEEFSDLRGAYAVYDTTRDEYRVAQCRNVFRYRWDEEGWTMDWYNYTIKSLGTQIPGRTGYPIDSLTGTVDGLQGTIDDLVIDKLEDKKIFLIPDASVVTSYEVDTTAPVQDQSPDGVLIDAPLEIVSGIVTLNRLEASHQIQASLEYEADEEQNLAFEYLLGGGATSTVAKTVSLVPTTVSSMVRVQTTKASRQLQWRLRSATLGQLKIVCFAPSIIQVNRAG